MDRSIYHYVDINFIWAPQYSIPGYIITQKLQTSGYYMHNEILICNVIDLIDVS